ncbi:MAG: sigma factor, partial [Candidatus Acidiferrales bacterium]
MATSPAAADAGLIAACQRGDREAFRRLFEKYKDRVYSLALHFSGNEAVAQDVEQRIFLKLYT